MGTLEETSEFVENREEGTVSAQAPWSWAPHVRGAVAEINRCTDSGVVWVVALFFRRSIRMTASDLKQLCCLCTSSSLKWERKGKGSRTRPELSYWAKQSSVSPRSSRCSAACLRSRGWPRRAGLEYFRRFPLQRDKLFFSTFSHQLEGRKCYTCPLPPLSKKPLN